MILALDMDDVIAQAAQGLLDRYNDEHRTEITMDAIWGKSYEELYEVIDRDKMRSYLFEPGFFRNLAIMEGAKEILPRLVDKHDVYIVTAAQQFPNSLREKYDWLDEHFPMIHYSRRVFCGDKSIIRADALVDDHAYNFERFEGGCYLYSAHHNTEVSTHKRLDNWADIERQFL